MCSRSHANYTHHQGLLCTWDTGFVIPVFQLLDTKMPAKNTDIAVSFFPVPWSWGLGAPTPLALLYLMLCEYRVVAGSRFWGDFPSLHGLWRQLVVADSLQDHLLLSCSFLDAGGRICFQNEAAQLLFSWELITQRQRACSPH